MCGKDGIFHGSFLNPKFSAPFSNYGSKKKKPLTPAEEAAQAEAEAAQDANTQVANNRRRRLRASLFAGGRSVLGAPAGRGAPAGGGSPATSSAIAGGSAMGGGARSYGGAANIGSRNGAYLD